MESSQPFVYLFCGPYALSHSLGKYINQLAFWFLKHFERDESLVKTMESIRSYGDLILDSVFTTEEIADSVYAAHEAKIKASLAAQSQLISEAALEPQHTFTCHSER